MARADNAESMASNHSEPCPGGNQSQEDRERFLDWPGFKFAIFPVFHSLTPLRLTTFVDQFPKMLRICQGLILAKRQLGSVEKVRERSFVQHAVHGHLVIGNSEIEPPVLRPKTIKGFSVTFDFSKTLVIEVLQIILSHLKLIKEFKLLQRSQLGNLRSTNFIKDDLKHMRRLSEHRTETHRKN